MKTIEVVAAVIKNDDGEVLATKRGYGDLIGKWEFPGGKIEPEETKQFALMREIKEEMAADIEVGEQIITVEYDYPSFHLTMHCFLCSLQGDYELLEHDDAKWLNKDSLNLVEWCPADLQVVEKLKAIL